jgi:hypothetical protein
MCVQRYDACEDLHVRSRPRLCRRGTFKYSYSAHYIFVGTSKMGMVKLE